MSHYDIHVGNVIKYPEMVMARTVDKENNNQELPYLTINDFNEWFSRIPSCKEESYASHSQGLRHLTTKTS